MSHTIEVPNELYELLQRRASQLQRSPDQLAAEALRSFLRTSEGSWEARLQLLLAETHGRPNLPAPDEIEADITAAAAEARESRRERRRPD